MTTTAIMFGIGWMILMTPLVWILAFRLAFGMVKTDEQIITELMWPAGITVICAACALGSILTGW